MTSTQPVTENARMRHLIAVVGAGNLGRTLGAAWARAGHRVVYGRRDPARPEGPSDGSSASVAEAIAAADVVVLAVPAAAVGPLVRSHGSAITGKIVVDATVGAGEGPLNSQEGLSPAGVRYVRAFCTLDWEVLADPVIDHTRADQFFTASDDLARVTAERLILDVGLYPVYVGGNEAVAAVDGLARLRLALSARGELGRRFSLQLLGGDG